MIIIVVCFLLSNFLYGFYLFFGEDLLAENLKNVVDTLFPYPAKYSKLCQQLNEINCDVYYGKLDSILSFGFLTGLMLLLVALALSCFFKEKSETMYGQGIAYPYYKEKRKYIEAFLFFSALSLCLFYIFISIPNVGSYDFFPMIFNFLYIYLWSIIGIIFDFFLIFTFYYFSYNGILAVIGLFVHLFNGQKNGARAE